MIQAEFWLPSPLYILHPLQLSESRNKTAAVAKLDKNDSLCKMILSLNIDGHCVTSIKNAITKGIYAMFIFKKMFLEGAFVCKYIKWMIVHIGTQNIKSKY